MVSSAGTAAPQLTVRALVTGALIGALLCLSNLYLALQTGFGAGVALPACLIAHGAFAVLGRAAPRRFPPLSLLEGNAMMTMASSVGFSTGGAIASASAAYVLVAERHLPWAVLLGWTFSLSGLGVLFALVLRRQMIERERLAFPSGIATAKLLRSLQASNRDTLARARVLAAAAALAVVTALWRDGAAALGWRFALPASFPLPGSVRGIALGDLTFALGVQLATPAIGVLVGLRVATWMIGGSLLCYALLVPWLHERGVIEKIDFDSILLWSVWPGSGLVVGASLVPLLWNVGSLVRSARSLLSAVRRQSATGVLEQPRAAVDVPGRAVGLGILVLAIAALVLSHQWLETPWLAGGLLLAVTFVLSVCGCRTTGETDTVQSGALGSIAQLGSSILVPGGIIANLAAAGMVGNAASSASDTLTNLKCGHLLGAEPRRQVVAQMLGCALGAAVIVPLFYLLIPDSHALGGDRFPAPATKMVLSVASVLAKGLDHLPPSARAALAVGLALGVILTVIEMAAPARAQRFIPSALGLGLGFLCPAWFSLSLLLGAAVAFGVGRLRPELADRFSVVVASGLIAGEAIAAVATALLTVFLGGSGAP